MKNYVWLVAYTIPAAFAGLMCGTVIVGVGIGLASLFISDVSFSSFAAGWALGLYMAMFAVMLGLLPVLLYGATSYALLVKLGRASYFTSAIIGSIPGVVMLAFDTSYGMLFIVFGVPVALCTHYFAKGSVRVRRQGANNSLKPSPLRGLGGGPL